MKVIEKDVPNALKKAELTLSSFRACHKHMKLEMGAREASRSMPTKLAFHRSAWQENRLSTFLHHTPSTFL